MSEKSLLYAVGFLIATVTFLFKKWMTRVDATLKSQVDVISAIQVTHAVGCEKEAQLRGSLDSLRESIAGNTKNIGQLTSSVDKLWITTDPTSRSSDKAVNGG